MLETQNVREIVMRKLLFMAMLLAAGGWPAAAQMHGGETVEVPLRVEGGRLLVPVQAPDGAEFEFALSTGTPPTVFSASTAARLGHQTGLTMGGVPLETEGLRTLPDEDLTVDGMVIGGMIGSTTLNQFDVLVDVPGGRLLLKPIGRSVEWKGMTLSDPVRLRVLHGVFVSFEVELDGRGYRAMLDLGMPALVVNEPVGAEAQIDVEGEGTLSLGGTTLPNLPIRVRDLPLFGGWDPDNDGFVVVGAPVAYDCAISISWVHREIRTCVR